MAENSKPISASPRRSRAIWQGLIKEWMGSDLSAAEFCQQKDLVLTTFKWWCRRLRRDAVAVPSPLAHKSTEGFVAVRVARDEPEGATPLELDLPRGVRLRVPPGYTRQSLVEVLRALEEVGQC